MAQQPLTPFGNALAGALGGVFSNAVVYPLDTVKTRIQAGQGNKAAATSDSKDSTGNEKSVATIGKHVGLIQGMVQIIKSKEGPMGLYKGFGASMVNTFSTQFAYFYWYTVVRTLYINKLSKPSTKGVAGLNTATELALGAIAGALAQIFTIPVSVIATRQQIGTSASSPPPTKDEQGKAKVVDESFLGVARDILKEDGITGFWRGLKPSLVLTVNPAITYGVFERIKTIILAASDGKMTPWKSFLVGALSKTLATVVTFPYILSKIRLQAKTTNHNGAIDVLRKIAKDEGIKGWYQGMQAQITKAVLAQALLFFFRDYFEIWTRQLLGLGKPKVAITRK
ncbi:mitochondrial carrier [Violaceomyces palustris]|uniref:Mitochondrial carrier n=1 Tax=Violaceomyces palustris TaxID=1673888 RepID=A0ACD0NSI1_9BASI|nr:mitochondrial carrier [Violaceomyces palustris]